MKFEIQLFFVSENTTDPPEKVMRHWPTLFLFKCEKGYIFIELLLLVKYAV